MLADAQSVQRIGKLLLDRLRISCPRLLHDEHSLDLKKDLSVGPVVRECELGTVKFILGDGHVRLFFHLFSQS